MTQVNFYTLPSSEAQSRLLFVCRLTEKAYSLGHRIHIQTESDQQSKLLDDLLWQYATTSFIPHKLLDSSDDCRDPVSVGTSLAGTKHADVLINLGKQTSPAGDQFSRINEVISADSASLEQGRNRYRDYKAKNYHIETFKL
ncbi:MAG: DNA polymerase III subunit chi [Gammaproteobacteria bacterium]|nr:DNA polymerase III subunit chi [Gammaproteobacteria bacterium]